MFLEYCLDLVIKELVHDALDVCMRFHAPAPFGVDGGNERTFLLLYLLFIFFVIVGFLFSFLARIFKERLLWGLLLSRCILCGNHRD